MAKTSWVTSTAASLLGTVVFGTALWMCASTSGEACTTISGEACRTDGLAVIQKRSKVSKTTVNQPQNTWPDHVCQSYINPQTAPHNCRGPPYSTHCAKTCGQVAFEATLHPACVSLSRSPKTAQTSMCHSPYYKTKCAQICTPADSPATEGAKTCTKMADCMVTSSSSLASWNSKFVCDRGVCTLGYGKCSMDISRNPTLCAKSELYEKYCTQSCSEAKCSPTKVNGWCESEHPYCDNGVCREKAPTPDPTADPTESPTADPTTASPTETPTEVPTESPTLAPPGYEFLGDGLCRGPPGHVATRCMTRGLDTKGCAEMCNASPQCTGFATHHGRCGENFYSVRSVNDIEKNLLVPAENFQQSGGELRCWDGNSDQKASSVELENKGPGEEQQKCYVKSG